MTKRGNASFHSFSTCCGSQPRLAALGSPFQGKGLAWTLPPSYGRRENAASQTSHEEGLRYENAAFPHCHFERKREIFFVRGQAKDVRIAASWKHRASSESEGRCFMQTALRKKTETGNEKDPSAALGMTKRGKRFFTFFHSATEANLRPFGAPPSRGRRENAASQTSHEEGLRYENAAFPHCHFERKREIFFVCGEAKAVRGAVNGKHRASCDWGGRCFMQELYEGKRKKETKKIPRLRSG